MKHNYSAVYKDVRLRPLSENDIEMLRTWRNDKSQTAFLRDLGFITSEMQKEWYDEYLADYCQVIFAIDEIVDLNRLIGSLSIYDIVDNRAEIGKIQIGDSEAHRRGIGRKSLVMAMKIGFQYMGLKKIIGLVNERNESARRNDLAVGFNVVGEKEVSDGSKDLELFITENDCIKANSYYNDIIINKI